MKHIALPAALGSTLLVVVSVSAQQTKGLDVYASQNCSACHSIKGVGNTKGPLDDVGARLTAEEIRLWIVHPTAMTARRHATRKPSMTGKYGWLPKDDISALTRYLASLKTKEQGAAQAAPPASGARK